MSHLGARVTALLDGELSPDAAARAHAHAAACPPCLRALETERAVRTTLATARDPEVPTELVERLVALGGPAGPLPPRPGHVPGAPRPPFAVIGPPPRGGSRRLARSAQPTRPEAAGTLAAGALAAAPPRRGPATTHPLGRRRARRLRRGLVLALTGSFSIASVGLVSTLALTGLLDDAATVAPASTRLGVEPEGRTGAPRPEGPSTTGQAVPMAPLGTGQAPDGPWATGVLTSGAGPSSVGTAQSVLTASGAPVAGAPVPPGHRSPATPAGPAVPPSGSSPSATTTPVPTP
ncbi:zf-HC2 domain-containing protein [Thalassiella azotivora]